MEFSSEPVATGRLRAPWLRPELIAPWWQIVLLTAVIIGFSSLMSGLQALQGSSRTFISDLMNNHRMLHGLLNESCLLGFLFVILHLKGWRMSDFAIRPDWMGSGYGVLLIPGMIFANLVVVVTGFVLLYSLQTKYHQFLPFLTADSPKLTFHSIHVSWAALIPALILNAFYEEITTMGFAFNSFAAKRGPVFALVVIVLLRMSCHTYQGVVHALGIGAAFTVSGLFYIWTRNLWPLILAHIIVDLTSVTFVKLIFG